MPLRGFVEEARKTNKKMELEIEKRKNLNNNQDNIIDISDGQQIPQEKLKKIRTTNFNNSLKNKNDSYENNNQKETNLENDFEAIKPTNNITPKTDFEKQYIEKQKQRKNLIGINESQNNLKQKIESKHGNIIANVIRQSGNSRGQKVHWKECKYLKADSQNYYCKEFHCFCKKEACPFSCK